ncbi:hypothetical protein A8W25_30070 [Streptomyces sp. ERV7]|uniref:hypothetical protein n=1 Tax=Streptomyces sp. ERV7 TaxID=1322334 RepID=UPI0007F3AB71|nr:hypothetical protein [Streptomyces sp. ERV7]OAR22032.1 hypothetical protein A8W25_30070 [Streptomyces sp. ERV7]
MFSIPRRYTALAAAGTFVALGLGTSLTAQADAPKTKAPATTTSTMQGCNTGVSAPVRDRPGHVSAGASSTGCANNWTFTAQLQSSRWWGWANDAEEHWIGSASRGLGASCSGVHDHRVILHWSSGPANGTKIGPVSNLNCG